MNIIKSIVFGREVGGGNILPVANPYSKKTLANIELCAKTPLFSRSSNAQSRDDVIALVQGYADYLEVNKQKLSSMAAKETGSPVRYHVRDCEAAIDYIRSIETYAPSHDKVYQYVAKGRILFILSANQPILTSVFTIVTALIMGNTVVVKPSTKSPITVSTIVEMLLKHGVPSDVLHLFVTNHIVLGDTIRKGNFDAVLSFAGSHTNRKISTSCVVGGAEFMPENEGNDWCYVDEQVNIPLKIIAQMLTQSVIKHNGQMCDSIRTILVHESQCDKFTSELCKEFSAVKIGNPLSKDTRVSSLMSGTQRYVFEQYGKKVFEDSERGIVRPTILQPKDIEDVAKPAFAPIVYVLSVQSVKQVITLYKKFNKHGLGFCLYSFNESTVSKLTKSIDVARMNINTLHVDVQLHSPWGGIKKSGEGGPLYWFERMSNKKIINYGQF